jgi:hypothetical protein
MAPPPPWAALADCAWPALAVEEDASVSVVAAAPVVAAVPALLAVWPEARAAARDLASSEMVTVSPLAVVDVVEPLALVFVVAARLDPDAVWVVLA